MDYSDRFLKDKVKKFKETVIEASMKLGVKQPIVKIWECPYGDYNSDEIAHCHHERGMICISERRLKTMSYDKIIDTATHEVAHLKNPDHSASFHGTHQDLKSSTWRPPSGMGITSFSESDFKDLPARKHIPYKPDKRKCNYYQGSDHQKGDLAQCKYCQRYFCKIHIKPRPAGVRQFQDYNKLSKELQDEANNPDSHPCIQYTEYFDNKAKEQNEKYIVALDKLFGKKRRYKEPETVYDPGEDYPSEIIRQQTKPILDSANKHADSPSIEESPSRQEKTYNLVGKKTGKRSNKIIDWLNHKDYQEYDYFRMFKLFLWNIIILAISIGFLIFSIVTFSDLNQIILIFLPLGWTILVIAGFFVIKNVFTLIIEFPNWFKRQRRWVKLLLILILAIYIWQVYKTRDLRLGYLNKNPLQATETEMSASDLNISNTAFNYINTFREDKNLPKFDKNPSILKLALFLAKDPSSGTTLNDNTKKELIDKFNVSGSVSFFTGQISESRRETIEQIVSNWEDNKLWNAPLLNSSYKSGATVCYENRCWMLVSTESYVFVNKTTINQKIVDWFNSLFVSLAETNTNNNNYKIDTTSDNNQGYFDKDYFVSNIKEVFKSEPERKEECKSTFNKLNQIRTENGKRQINWDDKSYSLAVARSKDMYERNYFDHVTPEGQCVDDFKAQYGFRSSEFLAENAGGMSYYSKGDVAGNCDEALNGWLESRGHRYNLLYDTHTSGAIGCYYQLCIFLGVNNDGFGAKPCSTGDVGLAFWQTASKQPGEV